jgi:hypothetical protein
MFGTIIPILRAMVGQLSSTGDMDMDSLPRFCGLPSSTKLASYRHKKLIATDNK